jgi:serine/threonine-protein kinase
MLYELLVGEPPFTGDSPVSIVVQHVSDAPARPSAANGDISTDIDSIVLKALAKDPAGRYQTASEMKADVERILGGHQPAATALLEVPVAGPPDMLDRDAATAPRRNAAHLFAIIIGVLVIASASAFGGYRSGRPATAALSTTDVPVVLGLGSTDAESVLRNAHLVPRFEFVHRADVASLGTVIKQSPNSGDTAATNSTVAVIINIGSPRDDIAIPYAGVARRPPTWPTRVTSSGTFSPDIRSRDSSDRHAQRSDISAEASVTPGTKIAIPRRNPGSPKRTRNLASRASRSVVAPQLPSSAVVGNFEH